MTQILLPFQYEEEGQEDGRTALAGLPLYLDLARVLGLRESMGRHVGVRSGEQGWTDSQVVLSLILLNLAGGDCVEDVNVLEGDAGFCRLLRKAETYGLSRKKKRKLEDRLRKGRTRTVPSASAVFRYLRGFHDETQEECRRDKEAFIAVRNEHLRGLCGVNGDLLAGAQRSRREKVATLDMDATLVETHKKDARFCYKGFRSYQPLNVWWWEQGLVSYTEFRDGNVPAGYEQLRVLKEALECLPEGVEEVRLRSDTAGYQHELLRYCELGENERFGRIEFSIGCPVTSAFKDAVAETEEEEWRPLYREVRGRRVETGQEWAEVCFVPNAIGNSKKGPSYRYVAVRECLRQREIPGMEEQLCFPFPTMRLRNRKYKITGIVTNRTCAGEELIDWHHKRCGKSEEAHAVMKEDLAGGKMPCGELGANAAWWWIMILAMNLNAVMKRVVLGSSWTSRRMKAMRFHVICLAGRVVVHARRWIIRLAKGHACVPLLQEARRRIAMLAPGPSG